MKKKQEKKNHSNQKPLFSQIHLLGRSGSKHKGKIVIFIFVPNKKLYWGEKTCCTVCYEARQLRGEREVYFPSDGLITTQCKTKIPPILPILKSKDKQCIKVQVT